MYCEKCGSSIDRVPSATCATCRISIVDGNLHPGSEDEQPTWYIEPYIDEPSSKHLSELDNTSSRNFTDDHTPSKYITEQEITLLESISSSNDLKNIVSTKKSLWPLIWFGVLAIVIASYQLQILSPKDDTWVPRATQPQETSPLSLPKFPNAPLALGQEIKSVDYQKAIVEVICGDLRVPGTIAALNIGSGAAAIITRSEGIASCAQDQLAVTDGTSEISARWVSSDAKTGIALVAVPIPLASLTIALTDNVPSGKYKTGQNTGTLTDVIFKGGIPNKQLEIGSTITNDGIIIGLFSKNGVVGTSELCSSLIIC